MAELVLLDTMICIWAFKSEATPGQEDKIRQAQAFITSLDEEGVEVGISAVTLCELMVALSDENRLEGGSARDSARQVVKADCQIAGTAISCGASVLYTEDAQLLKMAAPFISTKPMPPIGQQELEL